MVAADRELARADRLDRPRHKLIMRLPLDYPRINQFPEWFTAKPAGQYDVTLASGVTLHRTGVQLAEGLEITLKAGESLMIDVKKR